MAIREKPGAKLNHIERYLVEETIEDYQAGELSRREMIRRVLVMTGSMSATASILLAAGCGPTQQAATTAATTAPAAASPTATRAAAAASPTTAATPARAVSPVASPATPRAASPAASPATPARLASPGVAVSPPGSPRPVGSPGATPNPVTVSPNDPAIEAGPVQFPGRAGTIFGYRSQPRGVARAIGILVIHENRGLVEHIKDMTRRYAKDGFLAVAVDLVSRQGGTDRVTDQAQIQAALRDTNALAEDLVSAVDYLKGLPNFAGPRAGAVGYCFGGGMTWLIATRSTDIGAAVPYYGPPPDPIDDVQRIVGPVLAFYGETDQRINANIPTIEAAMQRYGKTFERVIYPGAGHAFNNDTGANYNAAAARDAYQRSKDWFTRHLQS